MHIIEKKHNKRHKWGDNAKNVKTAYGRDNEVKQGRDEDAQFRLPLVVQKKKRGYRSYATDDRKLINRRGFHRSLM